MHRDLYVVTSTDKETIETLTKLLRDAQAGRVIGLAYVALQKGDGYTADLVGVGKQHPLLARGICRALEDSISSYQKRR